MYIPIHNLGSQILNGTSNIQFKTIKCKFCQAIDCVWIIVL